MYAQWKNVGNNQGLFAPVVATSKGGYLLIANRGPDRSATLKTNDPLVVRVNDHNEAVWETSLLRPDFYDFEATSATATPDGGLVVYVMCYTSPGSGPVNRLVKVDQLGTIVWDWVGRGRGNVNTPHASTLQLTRKGTVHMKGHVYRPNADIEYAWTGEVDAATGKPLRDEEGGPDPYKRLAKKKLPK